MPNEYNLYSDFARVLETKSGTVTIELINRKVIHPTVKVISGLSPKEGEDGIVIYVGRFKHPYFIPFSFNMGAGYFNMTNENSANSLIDYSIPRDNWINKSDFIDFNNLKYIQNNNNEYDINWCNPNFADILKNIVLDWEIYCASGRERDKNNPNVNKLYPVLLLGYMSRKDGKLDGNGHVYGTPSIGTGHKTGTAIDINFQNGYEDYDNVDDYIIEAVSQFFTICKNRGIKAIGYFIKERYANRLNDLYVPEEKNHKTHLHISATYKGKGSW